MAISLKQYIEKYAQPNEALPVLLDLDREPDDEKALEAYIAYFKNNVTAQPIELYVMMGRGNVGKKMAAALDKFKIMQENGEIGKNITLKIIPGYGSEEKFKNEALDVYQTPENLKKALNETIYVPQKNITIKLAGSEYENNAAEHEKNGTIIRLANYTGTQPEQRQHTLSLLRDLFTKYPHLYVLSTEPQLAFVELHEQSKDLMKNANFWGTFSFNVRDIIWNAGVAAGNEAAAIAAQNAKDKGATPDEQKQAGEAVRKAAHEQGSRIAKQQVTQFLTAVNPSYMESIFLIGSTNNFTAQDYPGLFPTAETKLAEIFDAHMGNWKNHIMAWTPGNVVKSLNFANNADKQGKEAKVKDIMKNNWTQELEREIYAMANAEALPDFASLMRSMKIWKNLTQGNQFVAADAIGALAAINPDQINAQAVSLFVYFNKDNYTVLSVTEPQNGEPCAKVNVMIPQGISPEVMATYLPLILDRDRLKADAAIFDFAREALWKKKEATTDSKEIAAIDAAIEKNNQSSNNNQMVLKALNTPENMAKFQEIETAQNQLREQAASMLASSEFSFTSKERMALSA